MTMTDPQLAMGQQARIDLQRTIARGEAALVSMTDETPLTIRWNQGLLVTSKHLIETGGSATEPQYYEQIVIDLDNVTGYCRQGLYYLRRGPGKSHQFHINAYADQCIFVTEAGVPLFEMVGVALPPDTHELQSTGESNRYSPADMPFLFIRASAGSEPQAFKLGRNWSSESRSRNFRYVDFAARADAGTCTCVMISSLASTFSRRTFTRGTEKNFPSSISRVPLEPATVTLPSSATSIGAKSDG